MTPFGVRRPIVPRAAWERAGICACESLIHIVFEYHDGPAVLQNLVGRLSCSGRTVKRFIIRRQSTLAPRPQNLPHIGNRY